MRVLLTAFEPFDGSGWNAALEGCRSFLESGAQRYDLRFAVLPVRYGADAQAVDAALREGPFDLLLHTGQASGSALVRVERLAVNVRYPGDYPATTGHLAILPGGPLALPATIPAEETAAAIHAARIPAGVSNHAGIYLCNHVLYHSLLRAGDDGPRVGFIHTPCLPEQAPEDGPAMPAQVIGRAIGAALDYLARDPSRTALAGCELTHTATVRSPGT